MRYACITMIHSFYALHWLLASRMVCEVSLQISSVSGVSAAITRFLSSTIYMQVLMCGRLKPLHNTITLPSVASDSDETFTSELLFSL